MTHKKKLISNIVNISLAIFLVLTGFGLVFASSNDFLQSNRIQEKYSEENIGEVKAEKIYLPSMDRLLDISDGFIENNRWTVSETGVSHLTTSVVPGSEGNSVSYMDTTRKVS